MAKKISFQLFFKMFGKYLWFFFFVLIMFMIYRHRWQGYNFLAVCGHCTPLSYTSEVVGYNLYYFWSKKIISIVQCTTFKKCHYTSFAESLLPPKSLLKKEASPSFMYLYIRLVCGKNIYRCWNYSGFMLEAFGKPKLFGFEGSIVM